MFFRMFYKYFQPILQHMCSGNCLHLNLESLASKICIESIKIFIISYNKVARSQAVLEEVFPK